MLQGFGRDAGAVVAHQVFDLRAVNAHRQLDLGTRRGVAQGVVQQVAQRSDGQHRRHFKRRVRQLGRQVQADPLTLARRRIMNREMRHLPCRAIDPVIKRQATLDPRQQEQLLQGAVQAVGACFGMGQRLFTGLTLGHARHLQVGLDRG